MAYVSPELKAKLAPNIKAVLKKYGMKGTIAVRNHSTLVLNIKSGPLNIIDNMWAVSQEKPMSEHLRPRTKPEYVQVNEFWIQDNYTGKVKDFLIAIRDAMKGADWFDHSDIQTDYFHCSHYININVGSWDRPYILTKT